MQSYLLIVLIIALSTQIGLAVVTSKDAHSRGHNRLYWFGSVLIFGLLGIIIYLLIRNDSRLPESERPPKQDLKKYGSVAVYLTIGAIAGLILFTVIGGAVSKSIYPEPKTECTTESVDIGGAEAVGVSCEDGDLEKVFENQRNRDDVRNVFSLVGIIAGGFGGLRLRIYNITDFFSA
jgi:hypothetical protein